MAAVRVSVSRRGLCLLLAAVLCTVHYGGALEIYGPNELFVENGTYAKLPCTFKSTDVTSSTTSVTWTYTEEGSSSVGLVIFYYIGGKQYPGTMPRFKDRVTWAGDINNRDVSIKLDKITFKDNGTYSCSVFNPPDISSTPNHIKLRVVEKVHYGGALEIYGPNELFVENGTYVKLPCTFKSTDVTSSMTSALWTYTEEGSSSGGLVIFHYIGGKQYPAWVPPFKDRVTWAGDINNRDVSIKLDKITFKDNGTYSCSVWNPLDISSTPNHIKLRVVEKVHNNGGIFVENGAQATLPCTFSSRESTSNRTAILWMFSKQGPNAACMVILYFIGGEEYPGPQPQFQDRVRWAGDISSKNASIKIDRMSPEDNGSYSCTVINPPDVLSSPNKINLQVGEKETK